MYDRQGGSGSDTREDRVGGDLSSTKFEANALTVIRVIRDSASRFADAMR